MSKRSLLAVLEELQKRYPWAHWPRDPDETIDRILQTFRKDLAREEKLGSDFYKAWTGDHYWYVFPWEKDNIAVFHDDASNKDFPTIILTGPSAKQDWSSRW